VTPRQRNIALGLLEEGKEPRDVATYLGVSLPEVLVVQANRPPPSPSERPTPTQIARWVRAGETERRTDHLHIRCIPSLKDRLKRASEWKLIEVSTIVTIALMDWFDRNDPEGLTLESTFDSMAGSTGRKGS
jgi:hypothetical protein